MEGDKYFKRTKLSYSVILWLDIYFMLFERNLTQEGERKEELKFEASRLMTFPNDSKDKKNNSNSFGLISDNFLEIWVTTGLA